MRTAQEYAELAEVALANAADTDRAGDRHETYFLMRAQVLAGLAHVASMPTLMMDPGGRVELPLVDGGAAFVAAGMALAVLADGTDPGRCVVRLLDGNAFLVALGPDEALRRLRAVTGGRP